MKNGCRKKQFVFCFRLNKVYNFSMFLALDYKLKTIQSICCCQLMASMAPAIHIMTLN